jgi:hypothetical protein
VQAQSQDTTGHNGWGVVYSSPRSRQASHLATASPASATPASTQTTGATSGAGGAAAGWANGAAAPAPASAPAPAPAAPPASALAPTNTGAGTASYNTSYTPTLSAQPAAPAPAPANAAPPTSYSAGRVPGVIYSSNGAVYPPPAAAPAPSAPAPAYQAAPAPQYSAAPVAPPATYQAAPTYRGDPAAGAPPVTAQAPTSYQASYPGAPAATAQAMYPAPAPTYPAPAPTYPAPAPTYPAPAAYPAPAYGGANQYPSDHPTNLPPAGRTDASYDVDTNPPPGGAPTPVSSMSGPGSTSSVHLDELMSLHEWEASGASHLKPQEIAVLEKWIERYRQQVADSVTRAFGAPHATGAGNTPVGPISRTADGTPKNAHAVTAIRSGSRYVTLDDGSVWDVYASDQTETATWQAGDLVQVRVAPVAYGEFDHELVNNQRTGPVRAKFMGYAARQ